MKRTLVIVGLGLIGGAHPAQGAVRVPGWFYLLGRNEFARHQGFDAGVKTLGRADARPSRQ